MSQKIVIISNNPVQTKSLSDMLSEKYEIITADYITSMHSVLLTNGKTISAILLDIVSSCDDGYKALEIIHDNTIWSQIPVIVITEGKDQAGQVRAMSLGANGFIEKPCNPELLMYLMANTIELHEKSALANSFRIDKLTGMFNRQGFIEVADIMIHHMKEGYYTLSCFDIENFKVINDQYGTEKGDKVLQYVAGCIKSFVNRVDGVCCRITADNFAILYPTEYSSSEQVRHMHVSAMKPDCINRQIRIRIGRYVVDDLSIFVSAMFDRAAMAAESVRGRYDEYIAQYNNSMRSDLLHQQQIINDMNRALQADEFEPWFQPQYNHATGALIGAEALVRWRKGDKFISPAEFIPVFERNGFIYEMDKYIWDRTCRIMREWIDQGISPLPVSVNISRCDVLHDDFISQVTSIVNKYDLPFDMIRIEITESAFAESTQKIISKVTELITLGFTVEIDDFGSGFSSLNTLKDVPASILKLDMKFFENTGNSQRSGNIIESVVRMAKWLGMAVIAEGVEEKEQADYLKSIGCFYIQGYFYSKPVPSSDYRKLLEDKNKEPRLTCLQTVKNLDNNEFWNPKSMETLIFNSYVGGACIFEYSNMSVDVLRTNEQYSGELGYFKFAGSVLSGDKVFMYLDTENKKKFADSIHAAIDSDKEASCELVLSDGKHYENIRITLRVIAKAGDRYLLYCVVVNMTQQHNISEHLRTIVDNIYGGVTATVIRNGKPEFIIVNDWYIKMLGFKSRKQFEAENGSEYISVHPDDRERILNQLKTSDGGKKQYTMEYRIVRLDGEIRYIRNNICVINLSGIDEPVQLSVANDITEIRIAQQKERRVTQQLQIIMKNINGGIMATIYHNKNDVEVVYASDGFYQMYGYTKEQFQTEVNDVLEIIIPEDRSEAMNKVAHIIQTRGSGAYEYRCRRRDGKIIWVKCNNSVVSIDGISDTVLLAVTNDITAEMESYEQFRFLNESAHDILAQADSNKAINQTLQRIITFFDGDRSYIIELNNQKKSAVNTYEICSDGITSQKTMLENISVNIYEYLNDIFCSNQSVYVENIDMINQNNNQMYNLMLIKKIHSIILTPLFRDGELIGYAGIDNPVKASDQVERLKALGDYIAILLTRRDLTRKIRHDSNDIQTLMDDTPGGFCRMKIQDSLIPTIEYINKGFCRIMNMTYDEIMSEYGENAAKCFTPEDIPKTYADADKAIKSMDQFTTRCGLLNKYGRSVRTLMSGRFVKDESGDLYLNLYFTDITLREKKEEQQKNLLDNLPCGAALYEFDGENISVVHINKKYWQLVKRAPVNYGDASVLDVVYESDRNLVYNEIKAAISQNRDASCDIRIKYGESEYRPFHVTANVTPQADGKYALYTTYTQISDHTMSIQEMLPVTLSTMMSISGDRSYVKGIDLRYICCSKSAVKGFGFENEREIIGKTDFDLFDKENAQRINDEDKKIIKSGNSIINSIERFPSVNGGIRISETSKYPLVDTSGNIVGIYGVSRDITAQKEKEFQLEFLTDSIPGGIAEFELTDTGIKMLYFNDGFYRFSGYSRDEFIKLINDNPLALMYEEDRKKIHSLICDIRRKQENDIIFGCSYRCHIKDGGFRWMSVKIKLSKINEKQIFLNVIQFDITDQKEYEEKLRIAGEEYKIAADHGGRTICHYNISTQTVKVTAEIAHRLSLPEYIRDVPYGRVKLGIISKDTSKAYIEFYEKIIHGQKECSVMFEKLLPNNEWRWINAQATTTFSDDGNPVSAVISYIDVTEQNKKEEIYKKWQQSFDFRNPDSYTLCRCNLSKDDTFDSFEGNLISVKTDDKTMSFDDYILKYVRQMVHPSDRKKFISEIKTDKLIADYYRGSRKYTIEYREIIAPDRYRWIRLSIELIEQPHTKNIMVYLLFENIDKVKKEMLEVLERSQTDPLTGVLNRNAFETRVDSIISKSRPGQKHVMMMLDVDSFKHINDSMGHKTGDQVLIEITKNIRSVLRHVDLIGRLGGDEFMLFFVGISETIAEEIANRICQLTRRKIDQNVKVSISLGISVYPDCGDDFGSLYKKADKALYYVKGSGKNNYVFYNESFNRQQQNENPR